MNGRMHGHTHGRTHGCTHGHMHAWTHVLAANDITLFQAIYRTLVKKVAANLYLFFVFNLIIFLPRIFTSIIKRKLPDYDLKQANNYISFCPKSRLNFV